MMESIIKECRDIKREGSQLVHALLSLPIESLMMTPRSWSLKLGTWSLAKQRVPL